MAVRRYTRDGVLEPLCILRYARDGVLEPLFILEEPQYHRLQPGRSNAVRGAVLSVDGPPVDTVVAYQSGQKLVEAAVVLPCPELAALQLPNAATCRFQCDVRLELDGAYELYGQTSTRQLLPLFVISTSAVEVARQVVLARAVLKLPVPPATLVFTTQGGHNTRSYTDSLVSGFFSMTELLKIAGYDLATAESVLDIGCGTGRLLLGWHADRPSRWLVGVDINHELIEWNRSHLSEVAHWNVCDVLPPLPFEAGTFDIVQLASVFTHLPLEHQTRWLVEIQRILKPTGAAVVTLHGELYARLFLSSERQQEFADSGYVEVAGAEPGANAFSTFHSRLVAENLFCKFRSVRFFPRGNEQRPPHLFPFAALQDIYILRP